ncbi:transporter substrate-binding domain-containing protein|uniref:L-cystine transport system substrate-binding protein n=1 Tax=Dendrosporobacter quercicolus TaxID=146817 RepID=A0A1G9XGE2_9FIRM|nr:transporter substrate-binding domain-containing protein [Dendrosporobacter quercicolus]NSL49674.1 transporter substrate-binding domain-containing protein [Dendrosporobacter quercicolus DSM 1736]SDM95780.1 L-cystine transport system substrate-binding protein [Dendrosporobacter quercicolus]
MKTLTNKKGLLNFFLVLLFTAGLALTAGCSSGSDQQASTGDQVKTYYVATRGTFKPFTYMDDKDQLTGFDIEILKEVQRRNKDIKFEFKTMSIESAFVSLTSNQVDLIANQMGHNEERAAKYTFTKEVNNYTRTRITVKGDRNDITTLDDLKGKTMVLVPTSESARLIKKFNETAEPKINLIYTDKGSAETLNLIATGRADAGANYEVAVTEAKKTLGLDVKNVGEIISSVPTYFILRKDAESQQLADKIDATLKEMKADGTLKKLSEQFLGADYTSSSN